MNLNAQPLFSWRRRVRRRAAIRCIRTVCALLGCAYACAESLVFAQEAPAPSQRERRVEQNGTAKNTEELPGEQVQAILKELRQIRLLLEKQQSQLQMLTGQPMERVQMAVEADWHVIGREDAPVTI